MNRNSFLVLLTFCLSANVYAQFNYDSIALDLGYTLQDNFEYDEKELFVDKFNNDVFISYIVLENEQDNKNLEEFNKELIKEGYGDLLYDQIQTHLNEDTYYKFINYHIDELKNIHIIFRLYFEDGSINYHQYLFEPNGIATYNITDVFIYLSGEYFSETLQSLFYSMFEGVINQDGSVDYGSENFEVFSKIAQVKKLLKDGKPDKARKMFFEKIPEEKRNTKDFIFIEMELLDPNDDEGYMSLMERMAEYAADDSPALYLSTIDYHFINEDYQQVITSVDSLQQYTGDEFLETIKGTAYLQLGMDDKAEECFMLANETYPTLPPTYDYLLSFYEEKDDKVKFLNVIDTMSKYLEASLPLIANVLEEEYPEIVVSKEYTQWYKRNNEKQKLIIDSLNNLLIGSWTFTGMEDYEGAEIETSVFYEEEYGKTRPNFLFNSDGSFTSEMNGKNYETGFWLLDIAAETIDFEVQFNHKTKEGKEIIESGFFRKEKKNYYQQYSLYYHSFGQNIFKLYDPIEGVLVFQKDK